MNTSMLVKTLRKVTANKLVQASWTITSSTLLAILGSSYNNEFAWWILGLWTLMVLPPTYTIVHYDMEPPP
jgi:hypothetical protein